MDVIHSLGLGVIRFQLLVGDRPRGRDAVVMPPLAEILFAKAVERGAEQLTGTANEIMHLRLERPAIAVVPSLGRDITVVLENCCRVPVLRFTFEPVAAFQNNNALSRGREMSGKSAAASTAAEDDDVELFVHARSAKGRRCCA